MVHPRVKYPRAPVDCPSRKLPEHDNSLPVAASTTHVPVHLASRLSPHLASPRLNSRSLDEAFWNPIFRSVGAVGIGTGYTGWIMCRRAYAVEWYGVYFVRTKNCIFTHRSGELQGGWMDGPRTGHVNVRFSRPAHIVGVWRICMEYSSLVMVHWPGTVLEPNYSLNPPGIRSRSSGFWIDADIEVQMTTGEYRLDGGLVDEWDWIGQTAACLPACLVLGSISRILEWAGSQISTHLTISNSTIHITTTRIPYTNTTDT